MNIPENLKYSKDHEWLRLEGDFAYVGITDFAQGELGDIVFVEIESQGDDLNRDDIFGSVEAVKTVSDLFMPVAGVVEEVNPNLADNPEAVNKDPYGDGWMIRIKVTNPAEVDALLDAAAYKDLIGA